MVAAVLHLHEGPRPAVDPLDQMGGGFAHAHDVVDLHLLVIVDAEIRQRAIVRGLQLFVVADHEVDFGHVGEALRLGLRRAAGDDDAGVRLVAARLADRLPGLPHGFGRDGAGVDDHRAIVETAKPAASASAASPRIHRY